MSEPRARARTMLICVAIALASAFAVIAVQNALIRYDLPRHERLTTDFSSTYLGQELALVSHEPSQVVFLGDSVLWGYQLPVDQTAVGILRSRGCPCTNLAFKSGSPPNFLALAGLMQRYGIHPRAVVLQINQRVFNPADSSYRTLHPAIADLGAPQLTAQDRRTLLMPPSKGAGWLTAFDRFLASYSLLYAMRADIRAHLYGDVDESPVPAAAISPDSFAGTYDATPLGPGNTGVQYLAKTLALLKQMHVPVLAFMTPANHALLHDYIDTPEYRANGKYLQRLISKYGIRVLDLDAAFPAKEFIDNDHLTVAGNRRLASFLDAALSSPR